MSFSLYVHLPFCVKKCEYCDFESYAGRLGIMDDYISAVLAEAKECCLEYGAGSLSTAYFGGGTPSLMSPEQLTRLAGGLFELFPPESCAEITMEANPGALTGGLLAAARRAGVNRLSIGLQAIQPRLLGTLGRIHTAPQAAQAVDMAQNAGIDNVSVDVMFALPDQSKAELSDTLRFAAGLDVRHISCYSLILEEGTPLYRRVTKGELTLPDEETARDMQLTAVKTLKELGYNRYEISNYAKPGYESRHNSVYWTGGDYLGLGAAAHSYMRGERFSNPSLDEYMRGARHTERETIDEGGRLEESILLETRMTKGLDLKKLEREHGTRAKDRLVSRARRYPAFIEATSEYLRFNDEGLMVHSYLVGELVDTL